MKIVILDGYTLNPGDLSYEQFEKLGKLTVYDRTPKYNPTIVEHIGDNNIVITNKTPITREILQACPNIKYIGLLSTGYDVVDIVAARELGIPVTNIPAYSTDAVGQLAIALLLEICNNVGLHDKTVKEGKWQNSLDFCYWEKPLIELAGKTIGFIGFGKIGQKTATIAKALGMNIIAYNRSQSDEGKKIAQYLEFDELIKQSDIISLHIPMNNETEGIINKETISKMKDGVIIINTSRGGLVIEQDLANALNKRKIYAAGLDVVSVEPIEKNNPLLKAKNCFITPHIAWAPKETRERLLLIAVENLKGFIEDKLQNAVN